MARYFGVSHTLTMADHAALTLPAGNWSMGGWIKVYSNSHAGYQVIFKFGNYAASPSCTLFLYGDAAPQSNKGLFRVHDADGDGDSEWTDGGTFGASRVWQHFLVVRDGNLFTVYLDGVSHGTGNATNMGIVDVAGDFIFGSGSLDDYDLADWFKVDVALNTEQITALVNGVRPPEIGTRPAWYLPLLASLDEEIAALTVTNFGTTVAEHPPLIVPASGPLVARFDATRTSYYYQHLLAGAS